ncbi:MAG: chemotaxis protein CheB [Spirochaetia bacterium]
MNNKRNASEERAQESAQIADQKKAGSEAADTKPTPHSSPPPSSFPIVGIGASAGGLAAFEAFFSGMPSDYDPGMAFVLVQHLAPDHESMLSDLIKRYTRMQVFEVEDGMKVYPNCAYIIPPGHDMSFLEGTLKLHEPSAPRGHRLPIDFFFRSLAEDQADRAIAIVLSGTGSDGSLGIRAIKGEGGMLMVQSPETTDFDGMPRSAISTGMVDYVLPPADMADTLVSYTSHAFGKTTGGRKAQDKEYENNLSTIFNLLRSHSGHDFSNYKPNTVTRRIERRMALLQIETIEKYVEYIRLTEDELDALFRDLLIGVTNFFRDAEAFGTLEKLIVPELFAGKKSGDNIRVWSAGCSTGEEAYSIAILLQEYMETLQENYNLQVFATDIDGHSIATARKGIYPASIAADVSPERLSRYFIEESVTSEGVPESYRITKKIRDVMIFSEQDVIKDPPFSSMDLISCRNLMIYLNGELHKKIIPLFHYALSPGGILFLGTSESIGECTDLFHVLDRTSKIFKRKDTAAGAHYKASDSLLPPTLPSSAAVPQKGGTKAQDKKVPLREVAEKTLLQRLAPASALVNEEGDIFYLHGRTGMFLEPATGEVGHYNILKMAREGLRYELTSALKRVVKEGGTLRRPGLRVKTNDHFSPVNLSICPAADISGSPDSPPLYLVVLEEGTDNAVDREKQSEPVPEDGEESIEELRQELRAKEEYLQIANEELESANEELKSSNEEMQSMNEELQSTNEELETSKEELQSVNEELATVNTELQTKVADLSRANNDMNNLLAGTGIATIFVDHQLRILRFTPPAGEVINLIGSDVGRPVGHIVSNLENYDRLIEDTQEVLDNLLTKEAEVRNKKGDWFSMRIQPYRTTDNVIEGAVITFVNITRRKEMEDELKKQLSEKETLLREVHHRIKNNIASVESLLSMQIDSVTNKEALSVLQDAVGRVKSMKVLYDKLLISRDYKESSVKTYIEDLINSLSKLFPENPKITIDHRIEEFSLPSKTLFSLGITVNELLTNMLKYAFTDKPDGAIYVSLTEKKNHVTLIVEDNGKGLPEDFTIGEVEGFGLTLVKMLSDQLGGSYTISNRDGAEGTKSILEFDM